jgi:hypothetical protein|tara:strand:- start:3301 stop:3723 length:423 start_codon:yes stop_codon:yes gene_type:complete
MSRRNELIQRLIASEKFGAEKEQEQKFLTATAELILHDLVNIAITGVEQQGAGSLVINLMNDSTTFMSGSSIESDIYVAESNEDDEILEFLRTLLEEIDTNDWSKNVLITLISDVGTRTFAVEAGGSQESFRALAEEFSG